MYYAHMSHERIKPKTYSVSDIVGWTRAKTLNLNPDFQRRPVWKPGAKSYFIDTILRGFPTPVVFIRERSANLKTLAPQRDVVDGQQRLRTVLCFIDSSLLPDYNPDTDDFDISRTHNSDYVGKSFNQLPAEARQRILDYEFAVHVFGADVGDREILQSFARMNATGVKLNDQELRNAEYYGEFKTASFDLAAEQLERWRNWCIFTSYNIARMDEVELTSELLIVMISGISEKSANVIDSYYKEYDLKLPARDELAKRFRSVFDTFDGSFDEDEKLLFKKKTLFYCVFAAIYDFSFGLGSSLTSKKGQPLKPTLSKQIVDRAKRIENQTAPKAVLESTTRRTTHVKERKIVAGYLLDKKL
jgi:uncharacterized protein with ParB-like and HNH nuclease domain